MPNLTAQQKAEQEQEIARNRAATTNKEQQVRDLVAQRRKEADELAKKTEKAKKEKKLLPLPLLHVVLNGGPEHHKPHPYTLASINEDGEWVGADDAVLFVGYPWLVVARTEPDPTKDNPNRVKKVNRLPDNFLPDKNLIFIGEAPEWHCMLYVSGNVYEAPISE